MNALEQAEKRKSFYKGICQISSEAFNPEKLRDHYIEHRAILTEEFVGTIALCSDDYLKKIYEKWKS